MYGTKGTIVTIAAIVDSLNVVDPPHQCVWQQHTHYRPFSALSKLVFTLFSWTTTLSLISVD
jgi:hypothetical protein